MEISIKPNQKQLDKLINGLAHIKNGAPKAMSASINKVAKGMLTDTSKEIRAVYTIKAKDLKTQIELKKKASKDDLEAVIRGFGDPISLAKFKYKRNRIRDKRGGKNFAITAEVKKGQPRRVGGGFRGNFGKNVNIAKRKGKERFPVEVLHGPMVSSMMDNDGIAEKVHTKAMERLDKEIDRALKAVEAGTLGARR